MINIISKRWGNWWKIDMLPEYPRTLHLPYKPNTNGDAIATEQEASIIFSQVCEITEKVDGSLCGMANDRGHPAIRNHNHIMHKGFTAKKNSAAKMQFGSVWNWWYQNQHLFEALNGPYSVYGEWCVATHGMQYDALPGWFIAHSLYDYVSQRWVDPQLAHSILIPAGFTVVPVLREGVIENYEFLEALCQQNTTFASDQKREGIYVKIGDGRWLTHRFKMVREGFQQGGLWNETELHKNSLAK